jgi:hypothetical protein
MRKKKKIERGRGSLTENEKRGLSSSAIIYSIEENKLEH